MHPAGVFMWNYWVKQAELAYAASLAANWEDYRRDYEHRMWRCLMWAEGMIT